MVRQDVNTVNILSCLVGCTCKYNQSDVSISDTDPGTNRENIKLTNLSKEETG